MAALDPEFVGKRGDHGGRYVKQVMREAMRRTLPLRVRLWLRRRIYGSRFLPPPGAVRFGDLRRLTPISRHWGSDRGRPVDRYYIEDFLGRHSDDIRGRVLAIGDDAYTRRFGRDRVTRSDVLHVTEGNPGATIVGDLTCAPQIPSNAFDCIIFCQTLQLIYDARAAVATLHRILKPHGVVLATFAGISQTYDHVWGDRWCWGFTALSARRLFEEAFSGSRLSVEPHGNLLAAVAFLQGLAQEELKPEELDYLDPAYAIVIAVRAVK